MKKKRAKCRAGTVPLNRTCGHSTSASCQLGNGLRIVNGGSGQWKRLRSRMGHALDDDDDELYMDSGQIYAVAAVGLPLTIEVTHYAAVFALLAL